MPAEQVLALVATALLAGAHVAAAQFVRLQGGTRRLALSAFGGIAVGYLFVHLLPRVAHARDVLEESSIGDLPVLDELPYLLALTGVAVFYGIEVASRASVRRPEGGHGRTEHTTFVASMVAFIGYNGLVGYLLHDWFLDKGTVSALLLTVALAVHLVVNDTALREHHRSRYEQVGRWLLTAAPFGGWLVGVAVELPPAAVAALVAFLAGGLALNVLKEELPADRESRFGAFLGGAVVAGTALALV